MANIFKFYSFTEKVHEGAINLGSDTIKVMLTNDAPSLSWDEKADVTGELATNYGYTAGGKTLTVTTSAQSSGLYTFICDDITWNISGGSVGPFRYAIFYDDTASGDPLLWYIDFSYGITVTSGQDFTIDVDQTTGLYYAT